MKLAVAKIKEFLVDDDPNLKYLGLHALSIVAPKHLWAVLENREAVVKAMSDVFFASCNFCVGAVLIRLCYCREDLGLYRSYSP